MQTLIRPYIGIVGVKNVSESMAAAHIIRRTLQDRNISHAAQLGLQVTRTTLAGGTSSTSRRNPVVTDIPMMFRSAKRIWPELFTVIHFTPKDPAIVAENVRKLFTMEELYKSGACRGLQLNGQFGKLPPEVLVELKCEFPELKVILQLHRTALEGATAGDIAARLAAYAGPADYVLIDPSGGRGEAMDVSAGAALGKELLSSTPLAVGYAGGLKGENVRTVITELKRLTGTDLFSIDAEGGLRDKCGDGYGNDDFNVVKTDRYFTEAVEGFYPSK